MASWPVNDQSDPPMYNWIKDGTKDGQGMALNVQIVGKPWNEEMVLRVMKELQAGVKPNMPVHL